MKRLISLAICLSIPITVTAGWTRTYGEQGDDKGNSICKSSDGGYVIAGESEAAMGGWILKINHSGDTSWTTSPYEFWGGAAYSIDNTSDNGYIVTGYQALTDDGKHHLTLVKLDSTGQVVWSRTDMNWFEHDSTGGAGQSVAQTSDGGYITAGYQKFYIWDDTSKLWLVKTDSAGDLEWSRTYGMWNLDMGNCVKETSQEGYIIAGRASEDSVFSLMKINEEGVLEWTTGEFEGLWGCGNSVIETPIGSYVMVSTCSPFDDGQEHLWLSSYSLDGNNHWSYYYDGIAPGWRDGSGGRCIRNTSDSNFVVTGYTSESKGQINDLCIAKFDFGGYNIWAHVYGGDAEDIGNSVIQTDDDGYLVCGSTRSFGAGDYDIWLVKTDENGDTVSISEGSRHEQVQNWDASIPMGPRITLNYSNHPQGFHAVIFDVSGRKVGELHSNQPSGSLTWSADNQSPGVYFITEVSSPGLTRRVILLK